MLLINDTLLRMSKGLRPWILLIAALKLVILIGITLFATSISSVLGGLFAPGSTDLKAQLLCGAVLLIHSLLATCLSCLIRFRMSRRLIMQVVLSRKQPATV